MVKNKHTLRGTRGLTLLPFVFVCQEIFAELGAKHLVGLFLLHELLQLRLVLVRDQVVVDAAADVRQRRCTRLTEKRTC